MSNIGIIREAVLTSALAKSNRQYLVGNLQKPQELLHVPSGDIEIGFSSYDRPTADDPHFHPDVSEYQYLISGYCELLDIDTDEVHKLTAGDFYAIPAGVRHVQKSAAGTKIIFFKHPAGNDKTFVQLPKQRTRWLQDLDF